MKHDIQLIVFDIAGTTVKDNGEIADAFQKAMHEYGYEIPPEKIYPLMGYKKPEAIRIMLQEYETETAAITTGYVNAIHQKFQQLMISYYENTDKLQPLPNAEKVFMHYMRKEIHIGLDTGFSAAITAIILGRLGWLEDGLVDFVVSSDEVIAGRPHPYMIQKMMQAAGIADAKKTVKIGDTEVDIHEGKNAGCLFSIGITTGAFTRDALQVYQPDFIIDDLEELLEIL